MSGVRRIRSRSGRLVSLIGIIAVKIVVATNLCVSITDRKTQRADLGGTDSQLTS